MLASDVNKIYFLSLPYIFYKYIGGAPIEESGGEVSVLHTASVISYGVMCGHSLQSCFPSVLFSFTFILHVDRLN